MTETNEKTEKKQNRKSETDRLTESETSGEIGFLFFLLPQCISPFPIQVICHLVHLLLLLCSDGHHSGLMLLLLGFNLFLQIHSGAQI